MNTDGKVTNNKVIGYVRVENRDEIFITDQDTHIENFAKRQNLDLLQTEHETSNGSQLMRLGMWRILRLLACSECEPKSMLMTDDYQHWFREAMRPCTCKSPKPASGIVVDDIKYICIQPSPGARFTLDMCVAGKHVYVVQDKRCLSCCNPQAIAFVKKQMLDK